LVLSSRDVGVGVGVGCFGVGDLLCRAIVAGALVSVMALYALASCL